MKTNPLLSCLICLTASNLLLPLTLASIVDITEEDSAEPTLSVKSSRPETTYSGKLKSLTKTWGVRGGVRHELKAGEEFCVYSPALGMRNLSCHVMLSKYWDIDVKVILSNSEGEILKTGNVTVVGTRTPYASLKLENIARPDIFELCVSNFGSVKTVSQYMIISRDDEIERYFEMVDNVTNIHNISAEALIRIERRLADIAVFSKADGASVLQDYFRLVAIADWVNRRCAINCVLMLLCCFMSTVVIRRWFGSPRSSV